MVKLNCRNDNGNGSIRPEYLLKMRSRVEKIFSIKNNKKYFFLMDDKRTHIVIAQHKFIKALIHRQMLTIIHNREREKIYVKNCFN
jgi:hypothetical protein